MSIIEKEIKKVKTVLALPLSIPAYQRPYKWEDRHVNQLVDDLLFHLASNISPYRLGTVVLHRYGQQLDIVDGQQRLLTLTLLCSYLNETTQKNCNLALRDLTFSSAISIANLRHSAAHLQRRVDALGTEQRTALRVFLLEKCELVCVTLNDLTEAFQFFDSQNARGKGLEPYDLLKAFHLREMRQHSKDEQTLCVKRWERQVERYKEAEPIPSLHVLINDVLFRIRRWSNGASALNFSGKHIKVFKGINLQQHTYPHVKPLRAVDHGVEQYNADQVRQWDVHHMAYPFQSDQTLINGKRFFEYIEHYTNIYKTIFMQKHENKNIQAIFDILDSYAGRHRPGDGYVKNLFFCTLIYYYDKFGQYEFERVTKICFTWSYQLRLKKASIRSESIDNHARDVNGLFMIISRAIHPYEVFDFYMAPIAKIEATKVEDLLQFFDKRQVP